MTRVNLTIDPVSLCDQHLIAETREIARLPYNYVNRKSVPPGRFTLGTGHVLYCTQLLDRCERRFLALQAEMRRRGFISTLTWNRVDHPRDVDFINQDEARRLLLERINQRYPTNARFWSEPISVKAYRAILHTTPLNEDL